MDRSDVIELIKRTQTQNEFGVWEESYTSREIFCKVNSIRQSEFFEAGRNGLNPEYRFTVFGPDYEGEELLEYHGGIYSIYRTYQTTSDNLELYVERKAGTNGIQTNQG